VVEWKKDDLVNVLIDWVENDKKIDESISYLIELENITNTCGGHWIHLSDKQNSNEWVEEDKYVKLKESMAKDKWDTSYDPCLLGFFKPRTKSKKGWTSDIHIRDGNHRIAMMKMNNLKDKIHVKFFFQDLNEIIPFEFVKRKNDEGFPILDKNEELHIPYRKKIHHEIQEGK
tara:strand:- start:229 stop:747 length:519 start_codon:yes stop_codon:yes gene_type:complete